ncbi:MAG: hypothetical protein QOJ42_7614 [Acidobacteriaceae bacterium]|nr:hypothetical protein [Acidobacteriaceae bacterium]
MSTKVGSKGIETMVSIDGAAGQLSGARDPKRAGSDRALGGVCGKRAGVPGDRCYGQTNLAGLAKRPALSRQGRKCLYASWFGPAMNDRSWRKAAVRRMTGTEFRSWSGKPKSATSYALDDVEQPRAMLGLPKNSKRRCGTGTFHAPAFRRGRGAWPESNR